MRPVHWHRRKKENAQVDVVLCYGSDAGAAFIDRAPYYLPEDWAADLDRRAEAGVPEEVRFATKGQLAKGMLGRAFEAGVPARWIVADTVYGTARGLRGWLEGLPEEAQASSGVGSKGERLYDWACVALPNPEASEADHQTGRWLLVRRSIAEPEERRFRLEWSLLRRAHQAVAKRCRVSGYSTDRRRPILARLE